MKFISSLAFNVWKLQKRVYIYVFALKGVLYSYEFHYK